LLRARQSAIDAAADDAFRRLDALRQVRHVMADEFTDIFIERTRTMEARMWWHALVISISYGAFASRHAVTSLRATRRLRFLACFAAATCFFLSPTLRYAITLMITLLMLIHAHMRDVILLRCLLMSARRDAVTLLRH